MSALPSSKKTHSEKHKQIFRQLLKELPNKTCVDCKSAQHPRWASWNLGCFICIRCSGIHRSMGTHISRVKSVDLDVWTDEQVESMIKWGNEKCNLFWEAKLPANYVPDGSKIENYIRTKYDMKKWAASSRVPDPMMISVTSHVSSNEPAKRSAPVAPVKEKTPISHIATLSKPKHRASESASSLLDDDFGSFASSTSNITSASVPPPAVRASATFPSINPTNGCSYSDSVDVSAQPASPASCAAPSPRVKDARGDLKKSILSLYSSPSSSTSSISHQQPRQSYPQPNMNFSQPNTSLPQHTMSTSHTSTGSTQPNSTQDLSNSLLGLNFGGESKRTNGFSQNPIAPAIKASPSPIIRSQPPPPKQEPSKTQWSNEWNDSTSSVNHWATTPAYNGASTNSSILGAGFNGTFGDSSSHIRSAGMTSANATSLDDDLFKNVWG